MDQMDCHLSESPQPRLGVLVLENDETLEEDLRRVFAPDVARLHMSRVPSRAELNPDTLHAMAATLPAAADLLPKAPSYAAIAYGCTSGAMMIGAKKVEALITRTLPAGHITDPLTATLAALNTLKIQRLGLLTPYIPSVATPLRQAFEDHGLTVARSLSFGEDQEARVARISPQSLIKAATQLAQGGDIDGIFLSCTNLRTFGVIPALEDALNLPVLSSNQTLCWHMAQLTGLTENTTGPGRLWTAPVPQTGYGNRVERLTTP